MNTDYDGKAPVLTFKTIVGGETVSILLCLACSPYLCGNRHLSAEIYRSHAVLYPTFFNADATRWLRSSRASMVSTVHAWSAQEISLAR